MVKVKNSSLVHPSLWHESPIESFNDTEIVFSIPSQFKSDLDNFWAGNYSRYREEAKKLITAYSGLRANKVTTDDEGNQRVSTDARILILERDPLIRKYLEEELRVGIDPKSELLSPPKESEVYKEEVGELV